MKKKCDCGCDSKLMIEDWTPSTLIFSIEEQNSINVCILNKKDIKKLIRFLERKLNDR